MSFRVGASSSYLIRTANLPTYTGSTVMAWVNLRASTANGVFWAFGEASDTWSHVLRLRPDGVSLEMASRSGDSPPGTALTVGVWTHLCWVMSGTGSGQWRLYKNGILDITYQVNASTFRDEFRIGQGNNSATTQPAADFAHWISYERALTPDEILAQMQALEPLWPGDLNWWVGADDDARIEEDRGWRQRHWTITGTMRYGADPGLPRLTRRDLPPTLLRGGPRSITGSLPSVLEGLFPSDPGSGQDRTFAASLAGSGDLTAALSVDRGLGAALQGDASFAGDLRVDRPLAVAFALDNTMAADFDVDRRFVGPLQSDASHAAHFRAERPLSATLVGDAAFVAVLDTEGSRLFSATLAADANFTSPLDVNRNFVAPIAVDASFAVQHHANRGFAAALQGSASFASAFNVESGGDIQGVLLNDVGGSNRTAAKLTTPARGTWELYSNGAFVFTPETGWTGATFGTYQTTDGTGTSSPATVTFRVGDPEFGALVAADMTIASILRVDRKYAAPVSSSADHAAFLRADRRMIAPLQGNGDFVVALTVEAENDAQYEANLTAEASFAAALGVDRHLAGALGGSADFSASFIVEGEQLFAANLQGDASFAGLLSVDRPLIATLSALAELEADFGTSAESRFEASLSVDAGFSASQQIDRNLQAVLDVQSALSARTVLSKRLEVALLSTADLSVSFAVLSAFRESAFGTWRAKDEVSTWF